MHEVRRRLNELPLLSPLVSNSLRPNRERVQSSHIACTPVHAIDSKLSADANEREITPAWQNMMDGHAGQAKKNGIRSETGNIEQVPGWVETKATLCVKSFQKPSIWQADAQFQGLALMTR